MGLFDIFNPINMEDAPHVLNEGTEIRRRVDEFPNTVPPEEYLNNPVMPALDGPIPNAEYRGNMPYGVPPEGMETLVGDPNRSTLAMENWGPGGPEQSADFLAQMEAEMNGVQGGVPPEAAIEAGVPVTGENEAFWHMGKVPGGPEQSDAFLQQMEAEMEGDQGGVPMEIGPDDAGVVPGLEEMEFLERMEAEMDGEQGGVKAGYDYLEGEADLYDHGLLKPPSEVDPKNDPTMTPEDQENAVNDTKDENGNPNPDVAKVVAADPKGWKKAMGWVNDVFGINGQDLARFGLFYAGSRIAGYRHGDSMGFAFGEAMKDHRARGIFVQQASQKGIYTQASLDQFKKTGKYESLKLSGSANPYKIDLTVPYVNSKGQKAYVATGKPGDKRFVDSSGKAMEGDFFKADEPETTRERVVEYEPQLSKLIDQIVTKEEAAMGDKDPNGRFQITGVEGGVAAAEILIAETDRLHLDVDSTLMTQITGNAIRAAYADSKGKDGRVITNLAPYLKAQLRYYDSNQPWANALSTGGEKMPVEEWYSIYNTIQSAHKDDPDYIKWVKQIGEGEVINSFMAGMYDKYRKIEDKSEYEKREGDGGSGFKTWLKSDLSL